MIAEDNTTRFNRGLHHCKRPRYRSKAYPRRRGASQGKEEGQTHEAADFVCNVVVLIDLSLPMECRGLKAAPKWFQYSLNLVSCACIRACLRARATYA